MLATASGNTIQFWDREAGTFLSSLSSTAGQSPAHALQCPGHAAGNGGRNHAEIWDTVSHKLLAALPAVQWITDISFTPDGRCLAVGGRSPSTSVWCVSDSAARVQLGGFPSRPTSLAFSPDELPGDWRQQRRGLAVPGRRATAAPASGSGDDERRDRIRQP